MERETKKKTAMISPRWRGKKFSLHIIVCLGLIALLICQVCAFVPNDLQPDQWYLNNIGQSILPPMPYHARVGTAGADIHAIDAWDITNGSPNVVIALIDSGVTWNTDLMPAQWQNPGEMVNGFLVVNGIDDDGNGYVDDFYGWDFVDQDMDPADQHGHGTADASIMVAASDNGLGIAGIAPDCKLMNLRVLNETLKTETDQDLIKAINYANDKGADIIVFPINAPDDPNLRSAMANSNALIVVSAGNYGEDSDNTPHYPDAWKLPNVLSVAATTSQDKLWGDTWSPLNTNDASCTKPCPNDGSTFCAFNLNTNQYDTYICTNHNWQLNVLSDPYCSADCTIGTTMCIGYMAATTLTGQSYSCNQRISNYGASNVDVGAPGENILVERFGPLNNPPTDWYSGTSQAAAIVGGVAALVKSVHPELDNTQLKSRIMDTVDPIPSLDGMVKSEGRVNAHDAIIGPTLYITYPNGGEKWGTGYNGGFEWTSNHLLLISPLTVTLQKDSRIIETWYVDSPSGQETPMVLPEWGQGDNYKICIQDFPNRPWFQDCSDGTFTIEGNPIKIIEPVGGEYWPPGSTQTINWSSTVCSIPPLLQGGCVPSESKVDVKVMSGSSSIKDWPALPNTGCVTWTIPLSTSEGLVKVKVTSDINPYWYNTSKWLHIGQPPHCVKIPNGKSICADFSVIDLSAIARGSGCPPICPTVDIFKIHYSATGAVNIPLTTVAEDAAFPMIDKHGLTTITYYTEDSFGHLGTPQTIEILIDRTPDLTNPGDKSVSEGKILQINLVASDKDGDPLTYSFTSTKTLPGAVISGNTFIWTPGSGSAGMYSVTFKATDTWGLSDEETIKIIVNVPTNVKIVPKTINLGSKGYFLAFTTLPESYKGATIDMKTVSCSGAPAVRMMKLKFFPRMVGFVFKTSALNNVEVGKRVTLTVKGELKDKGITYTFTGSDDVKVISKPSWQPDDIKDVSKVSDDQLFKKFNI